MTEESKPKYANIAVYWNLEPGEKFNSQQFSGEQKEAALDVVRGLKATYGEPKLDFVEGSDADALHFKFGKTGVSGCVVFRKLDLCEGVRCPSCGVTLKRVENGTTKCHRWIMNWLWDTPNLIWRVKSITREDVP